MGRLFIFQAQEIKMKLKYVGLKDRETAFSDVTGIVWEQGKSEEIKDEELAKRMLNHPDVFAIDEGEEAKDESKKESDKSGDTEAGEEAKELDKLRAQAKELGIKVHPKHGIAKMRKLIAEAQKPESAQA
jgi:hypothetical protein